MPYGENRASSCSGGRGGRGSCLRAKTGPRPVRGAGEVGGLASGRRQGLVLYGGAVEVGVLPRGEDGASSCPVSTFGIKISH